MITPVERPIHPDLSYELSLQQRGLSLIAGLDEAGRGAWAGPVVAAAVILPLERFDLLTALEGVRDSKQMTADQRAESIEVIRSIALDIGVGVASAQEVDERGLMPATRSAMARALDQLRTAPDHLLVDHMQLPDIPLPQTAITRGDAIALSISAASVIAKVTRDEEMIALSSSFPQYHFASNKGYGTPAHRQALYQHGPCPLHRFSYAPVANSRRLFQEEHAPGKRDPDGGG
jgi:ribonuclease HII